MTKAIIDQQEPQDQVASTAALELDGSSNLSKRSDAEPSLPSSHMTHGSRAQEESKVHEVGPAAQGPHQQLDGRAKTVEQAHCRPAFIQNVLEDPPILPWEDRDQFLQIFLSFEEYYSEHIRRNADYLWLMEAAKAAFELFRIDRMRAAIIVLQQRPAMAAIVLDSLDFDPDLQPERLKLLDYTRETSSLFYKDPKYREKFTDILEKAGFGREAAAGAAFLKALPSLTKLDQLRTSAEKTRDKALKRLDALSDSTSSLGHLPAADKTVALLFKN